MRSDRLSPNVNVPLVTPNGPSISMAGKSFPCPVCAVNLPIRIARTQKPYCVCMDCGIQIFVRGKNGNCAITNDPGRQNACYRSMVRRQIPLSFYSIVSSI